MNNNPFRVHTVNGREYAILPMSPIEALRFSPKVISVISTSLDGVDLTSLDELKDSKTAIVKILSAVQNTDPDAVSDLLEMVFRTTIRTADGQDLKDRAVFDTHFRKYPSDMLQLGFIAIWENSKTFLLESLGKLTSELTAGEAGVDTSSSLTAGEANT